MNYSESFIENLAHQWQIEWDTEKSEWKSKFESLSRQDKLAKGMLQSGLKFIEKEPFYGNDWRWTLEVSKTDRSISKWSPGTPVVLRGGDRVWEAWVYRWKKEFLEILISEDTEREKETEWSIELSFKDYTYQIVRDSLQKQIQKIDPILRLMIEKSQKQDLSRLEDDLPKSKPIEIPSLNSSQITAIQVASSTSDYAFIHGPPGTGKTTVLSYAVLEAVRNNEKILAVAPSNYASDNILEALIQRGIECIRIGTMSKISDSWESYTWESKLNSHPSQKLLQKIRKDLSKFRYPLTYEEKSDKKYLYESLKNIEKTMKKEILDKTQAFVTTCAGINNYPIDGVLFDRIFIDEASQASDPLLIHSMAKAKSKILIGDPNQLGPVLKSSETSLSMNFLTRMVDLQIPKVVLLDTQYRMHPSLYTFSNDNYYKGKIRSEQGMDLKKSLVPDFIKNLIFIDTSGTDWSESWDENLESFSNPEEAEFLIQFINSRKDILQNHDFSAITPYRAQKINIETNSRGNIPIHTIDSFQGRETDILFCSLVRSNTDREIGFLEDDKRLNVLLTRARNQLILIGDGSTLSTSKKFQKLLKTIEIEGEIHSAFEFME